MKVSELIAELQSLDPESEVQFVYCYGDHSKTNVAAKIKYVEDGIVRYSEYFRMDTVVDDEEKEDKEEDKHVCLLW